MAQTPSAALEIGEKALIWLAGNSELLPIFLGSSGASIDDIKAQHADPAFLGSVLDFILMDDAWVMAFCEAENLSYEAPMRARMGLPGGSEVHWT